MVSSLFSLNFRFFTKYHLTNGLSFDHHRNMEGVSMDEKHAIAALGALAQETRLALFRLLVTVGPVGLPAGVIAERLGVQPSSLSFHLAQLVHAGLITQRRLSRQLIYSAEYGAMNALLAYLTENCCGRDVVSTPVCDPAADCCAVATTKITAA
jgi:ArsR family transcriptional regulator, arsenate/arsenite/antimonite-responsive transcriptional repressor